MQKIIFFLSLISLCCISCERYEPVDAEIPFAKKAVVTMLINADSKEAELMLTLTEPINAINPNNIPNYITDANVVLWYKNQQHNLVFDAGTNRYRLNLDADSFLQGELCKLQVLANGEDITGQVVIPTAPTISYAVEVTPIHENEVINYKVKIKYTLLSAQPAHVMLNAFIVNSDSSGIQLFSPTWLGEVVTINPGQTIEEDYIGYGASAEDIAYRVKILTTAYDAEYAKYYNKNFLGGNDFGNPFQEPTITYSNLSNKIGIIGAATALPEHSEIIQ